MNEHPLQEYIDLIENNYIKVIFSEFHDLNYFTSSFEPTLFDDNEINWDNDQNCYIQTNISKAEVYRYTFNDHIASVLSHYSENFRNKVRFYLLENSERGTEYAKQLQREITNLMRIAALKHRDSLEILLNYLKSLDHFLSEITGGNFVSKNANQTNDQIKIKWLGKTNILVTLFYDLFTGENNLKKKFIDSDRKSITNFILNNFLDSKGDQLSKNTVYTILDPEKFDKKAKERLSIRESNLDPIPENELPTFKKHFFTKSRIGNPEIINPHAKHPLNKKM